MTITFFSNFINHHQKFLSDELYKLSNCKYVFVEVTRIYDWLKVGGYSDYSYEPYVLRAWENNENMEKARELAKSSDVALFGGNEVLFLAVLRAKSTDKLSFEVSERWLKRGWLNIFSPRLLKSLWYYHVLFYRKPYYKLCASAFAAKDQYVLGTYRDRCFKWGYFTKVQYDVDCKAIYGSRVSILWCSRFLKWKHPELPIYLAKVLKGIGYDFHINMIGSGEKFGEALSLSKSLCVEKYVSFLGNMPNEQVLQQMRRHQIFLFTSDRNEGWGAVANEAMSAGCVLIASDAIGSTPYLVRDGINGLLFRSSRPNKGFGRCGVKVDAKALVSLTEKVCWVLDHHHESAVIAKAAVATMTKIWSPQNAAISFMRLVKDLQRDGQSSIVDGPCSKDCPV